MSGKEKRGERKGGEKNRRDGETGDEGERKDRVRKKRHVRKKRVEGVRSREAYDGSQNGRNRNVYPSNVKAINVSLAATAVASDSSRPRGRSFVFFLIFFSRHGVNGSVFYRTRAPINVLLDRG